MTEHYSSVLQDLWYSHAIRADLIAGSATLSDCDHFWPSGHWHHYQVLRCHWRIGGCHPYFSSSCFGQRNPSIGDCQIALVVSQWLILPSSVGCASCSVETLELFGQTDGLHRVYISSLRCNSYFRNCLLSARTPFSQYSAWFRDSSSSKLVDFGQITIIPSVDVVLCSDWPSLISDLHSCFDHSYPSPAFVNDLCSVSYYYPNLDSVGSKRALSS